MFKNRKAQIEKQNDLITRAESLVNKAESEKRELTEDEAAELAEIRDDIQRIKKYLDIVDEIDDARPTEKVEGEVKEAKNVIDGEDARACGEDKARAIQEERAFENFLRNKVVHERAGELAPASNGAIIPTTIAQKIIELVYDIPIRIAPGVLRMNIKPVITRPIRANSAEPPVMSPRVTSVESLATTTPALSKPMKAINRPIPALMALRRLRGMAFTIASRTLVTVSRINTNPSSRIAVRANCHE